MTRSLVQPDVPSSAPDEPIVHGRRGERRHSDRRAGARQAMSPVYRARAPLRISFAGGGTDVAPFPEREGGIVLSTTINRYAYGTVRKRHDGQINVESLDFGLTATFPAGGDVNLGDDLDLPRAAIGRLRDYADGVNADSGFDMFLHSAAPPGSGLGSSSAMMVTLVGAMQSSTTCRCPSTRWPSWPTTSSASTLPATAACSHYAAAFGGFNFIEFDGDRVIVNPLRIAATSCPSSSTACSSPTPARHDLGRIIEDQTSATWQAWRTRSPACGPGRSWPWR